MDELANLRSKFLTANLSSKSRVVPKVFTEKGLYMLATILKGEVATRATLAIIETYAQLRSMVGVGFAFLVAKFLAIGVKLYFGSRIAGISIRKWVKEVLAPLVLVSAVSCGFALFSLISFAPSFGRVVLTTVLFGFAFLPLVLFLICKKEECNVVRRFFSNIIVKVRMSNLKRV